MATLATSKHQLALHVKAANRHTHYHCCILDGVLEPREDGQIPFLRASALTAAEIAGIGEQVRRRVLRWFAARPGISANAVACTLLPR
ncbi:MAG: hypothetical protein WCA32_13665 [Chromatiaceae bacterium]|jgi:hypothetical protein